ncbi:hypothetical protein [Tenacibaculum sp. M341]|uniref:hypothetical protein n=1 Tax=Tenacibaculum sp. M341 TaxID=2530339 RepID=UPI0010436540|nr:hypothetical protein [Tenacibaculum sp. M341]TCI94892.1 hypothetical protein EYW44_00800 [Tenacibaculum sp. M341]
MKKLLFLTLTCVLFYSCSKNIDAKTLEGTWWLSIGNGDYELSFKKDSIYIDNGYGLPYSGKYYIRKDSIFMNIENTFTKAKILYNKKDSLLIFNNSKYWKRYDTVNRMITKKFDFINIETKNIIDLNNFKSINYLLKVIKNYNNELKVILNDKITDTEQIPYFLASACNDGENSKSIIDVFVGKNVSLSDLKEIYIFFYTSNYKSVRLVTNYNFETRSFYFTNENITLFLDDISMFPPPPPHHGNLYRKYFIKKFNPVTIEISSANDFDKLSKIVSDRVYLISIDVNLPMKDYLHLTQVINNIRKNKKVKIHTEILE